jgi:hypothetical protein
MKRIEERFHYNPIAIGFNSGKYVMSVRVGELRTSGDGNESIGQTGDGHVIHNGVMRD